MHLLYENKGEVSAHLFKVEAGGELLEHLYTGYEHIVMLSGKVTKTCTDKQVIFQDKGDLIISKPGTRRWSSSEEGGIGILICEKPKRFSN